MISFILLTTLSAVALTLYLRQRFIQPENVVGTQVTEECLNNIQHQLARADNRAEAL